MEFIILILFFGPLLARIFCPTHLDSASALGLAIGNIIIIAIWAALFVALEKILPHWLAMTLGWVGLIGIQGVFFRLRDAGHKMCGVHFWAFQRNFSIEQMSKQA